ncbi:SirB2 family protein [Pseudogulbenkiania sp. MAI-1]|uniref:SirB2 family protein n=1 Tax=Pseudogulbenkiania sp. MAI-1 TaxID=990370 RepID=UPI00045E98A5|nr:SirB2 family protein [Pseudogulbenkiania sp. MAI-1]
MPTYTIIKHAHMGCAYLSILLFTARGALMLADSPLLQARPLRILPHVIDTLLLTLGITLAVLAHFLPTQQDWLMAKIVLLLVYIGLGTVALKRGRTKTIRTTAFAAALATVLWIVLIAKTKMIWPL